MKPSARPTGYLPTLDGWRAIAVGMVMVAHAGIPPVHHLDFIADLGSLGVDLFFAISGILICSRLLEEERISGSINLRGFYIRRTFRIFAPAWLYLAITALLTLSHTLPADWPAWTSAVFFVRNYFAAFVRETPANFSNGHFWSLAIEEHFYLLLPGLLVLFPKRRKLVLSLLILLCLAWLIFYMAHNPGPIRREFWDRRTDLRLNSLLIPALLALFLSRQEIRQRIATAVSPLRIVLLTLVLIAAGAAYELASTPSQPTPPVQATIAAETTIPSAIPPQTRPWDADFSVAKAFIVPVLFPFFILATMLHPTSVISRWLELQPLRAVGRISYSIYLWQQLFWTNSIHLFAQMRRSQIHLLGLLLTVVAALASYYLVEKPAIRLGHRLAPPSTPGHRDLDSQTSVL